MNKNLWLKIQPHLIAIGVFLAVSILYCLPALKGMMVNQHDLLGWKGMAQQSFEFKEKYGHFPLWTNSLFSGMPAFQVALDSAHNITIALFDYVFRLGLPSPISLFFLSCISFYLLANVLKLRTWPAIFGSLAYSFASYNVILIAVGHTTKFSSMGYAPAVIAGFLLLTQRKYLWGFAATLLFSTLLFYQNHIQIVYYTLLVIACAAISFALQVFKNKDFKHVIITAALGLVAAGIGAGSYAVMLLPLNEYAKETMRGGRSELTINKPKEEKTAGGLDKEYAFAWSYGIDETLTIALPGFKGGSSGPRELGDKSKAVEAMVDAQFPEDAVNYFGRYLSSYWGPQSLGTSGPVYFGVLVVLLFIIGLFTETGWLRNWLIAATALGLLLAWGKNLSSINYWLFDHLPFYNKFRAPSIAMAIPQLTFSILASMALNTILYGGLDAKTLMNKLKNGAWVAGTLALTLIFIYFTANFKSSNDAELKSGISQSIAGMMSQGNTPTEQSLQQASNITTSMFKGLVEDRKALYLKDLLRTLALFLIGSLLLYWGAIRKISAQWVAIICSIILIADLLSIDNRYLNAEAYVSEDEFTQKFTPNRADIQIKRDTGYFRVFDRDNDFSDDSRSAYHHNSIGGYHPAKLGLYQDLLQNQLTRGNMAVFSMLNAKYFIIPDANDKQPTAVPNPNNLGPCWLVKNIKFVNNADEEMKALDSIKPLDTAYVDIREKTKILDLPKWNDSARIYFVENKNDFIKYTTEASSNQFAILSEIYYPYGWKATIDGKETPIARVNYAFRGISIPAGNHTLELRFEPETKAKGDNISLAIGIISWILLLGALFLIWRKSSNEAKQTK